MSRAITLAGKQLQLKCYVKPGASKQREGITSIDGESVELCVAAAAREGEANKAVREVLAAILKVPRSNVDIARGHKSREKTVIVSDYVGEEGSVKKILEDSMNET